MKIKTSELEGIALDWAVAKVEDSTTEWRTRHHPGFKPKQYSSDWSQGGPIIERGQIELLTMSNDWQAIIVRPIEFSFKAGNRSYTKRVIGKGASPLIAAMRCYVASKLGDEVKIPDTLMETHS